MRPVPGLSASVSGNGMFIPNFFYPRIQGQKDSRIRINEFKYFTPKELFLSSRKYDLVCLSRIRIPDLDFLPISEPEAKKAPDPGSATLLA